MSSLWHKPLFAMNEWRHTGCFSYRYQIRHFRPSMMNADSKHTMEICSMLGSPDNTLGHIFCQVKKKFYNTISLPYTVDSIIVGTKTGHGFQHWIRVRVQHGWRLLCVPNQHWTIVRSWYQISAIPARNQTWTPKFLNRSLPFLHL